MLTYYEAAEQLIDFEPGSCFGYAKTEFAVLGINEVLHVEKDDVCEYTDKGIKKISGPKCYNDIVWNAYRDDAELKASARLQFLERAKLLDEEYLLRGTGRATGRANSSGSSYDQSFNAFLEHPMRNGVFTKSVQLDYKKENS